MDMQTVINMVLSAVGFFGGWVLNSLTRSINRIEDRLQEIPSTYLAKDDYRDDIKRIHEMLDKIFSKLDEKADK